MKGEAPIEPILHTQSGRGQDIIFLHGWGGDRRSLAALAAPFSAEYRVTRIDFPGHGESPHPECPLTLADFAESVVGLIRSYKMSSVILVGHSFGGKVALYIARHYASLVDKIVLIDASGVRPRRSARYYLKVFLYKLRRRLGLPVREAGSADYRAAEGAKRRTFINIVNTHLDKELHYITLPALILWGAQDAETPLYMARKLARKLPGAKLAVLDGAGHFAYLDRYAECLALIKKFIGGGYE